MSTPRLSSRWVVLADVTGDGNVWVEISKPFRVQAAAAAWADRLKVGAWRLRKQLVPIDKGENGDG